MQENTYSLNLSLQNLLSTNEITGGDLHEVRHMVRGGSIIDWPRLFFRTAEEVNEFLRVAQYEPDNRLDLERLWDIHRASIEYVRTVLGIDVPEVLAEPHRIQNIFLTASVEGPNRARACMLLKVMHVINHLEARELFYHLPVSEREFFARVENRVSAAVNEMLERGFPIETYQASQKTKESLVTKLLSKRKDTAAQVFDRIRFRVIASHRKSIFPILVHLKRTLIPFPYVIPGESANNIAPVGSLFEEAVGVKLDDAAGDFGHQGAHNPFSHRDFRVISFVADLPIRVDDLTHPAARRLLTKFGHIVFIPTEFQIFDKASYFLNESGPAAHQHYKARQISEVIARLYLGADEPNGAVKDRETGRKAYRGRKSHPEEKE